MIGQTVTQYRILETLGEGGILLLVSCLAGLYLGFTGTESSTGPMELVPLTSYIGNEMLPSLSPDGSQLAFMWDGETQNNYDIYILVIGTESPLRLTEDSSFEFSPVWSPGGETIAFLRSSPGQISLVLVPPIGGPGRQVATIRNMPYTYAKCSSIAWHPDGEWLVVPDKVNRERPSSLFRIDVATGEKRQLTSPPLEWMGDFGPAFSPDGRTLAFSRMISGGLSEIYTLSLSHDTEADVEAKRMTFTNGYANGPAWTPDGHGMPERSFLHHTWMETRTSTGSARKEVTSSN